MIRAWFETRRTAAKSTQAAPAMAFFLTMRPTAPLRLQKRPQFAH
jgi:hypothetical protein